MMKFEMDEKYLDYTLVPAGLLVLGIYHYWLLITITRHPTRTVIGLNRSSRYRWVYHMMSVAISESESEDRVQDPQKNGVLAVQTIRNNLMASTLLATISITLSSLISAVVSSSPSSSKSSFTGYTIHQFKYFAVLVCFLVAFFCNMQCTRYYAHVSFLVNVPSPEGRDEYIEYVAQKLNRGSLFWSLGLRAFYFSFPLLLWIFGPITMFGCSCVMAFMLYFLDTASLCSRYLPPGFLHKENSNTEDVESVRCSIVNVRSDNTNLSCPLLGSTTPSPVSD